MKIVHIKIGEIYASLHPTIITTMVGSCIAVCLYDTVNSIGGMNHILLPGKADMNHVNDAARYGIDAIRMLTDKIIRLGGDRQAMIAKVFGGAHVIPVITQEFSVGKKNAEFVIDFLKQKSVRIAAKDIGGFESRRIFFHTDTGDVFVKRLKPVYRRDEAMFDYQHVKLS